mgnify:CR=1
MAKNEAVSECPHCGFFLSGQGVGYCDNPNCPKNNPQAGSSNLPSKLQRNRGLLLSRGGKIEILILDIKFEARFLLNSSRPRRDAPSDLSPSSRTCSVHYGASLNPSPSSGEGFVV